MQTRSRSPRSAFGLWLRTGRWTVAQVEDPALEVKFNPYHDPTNGQFTFAPGGGAAADMTRPPKAPERPKDKRTWGGRGFSGGGGGSFGGGGASATEPWGKPDAKAPKASSLLPRPATHLLSHGKVTRGNRVTRVASKRVTKNGYDFTLDPSNRTLEAKGSLSLAKTAPRSTHNQKNAGGPDRRSTDDGGHFIAARFNGPRDAFDHFAQNSNFNRGAYRTLEDKWSKNLKAGKHVFVDIAASYPGASRRPSSLYVHWWVDGRERIEIFKNAPKGK